MQVVLFQNNSKKYTFQRDLVWGLSAWAAIVGICLFRYEYLVTLVA